MNIPSNSPINQEKLSAQNRKYLNLILTGQKVNVITAIHNGIMTPHSRVAEVRDWLKRKNIQLNCQMTKVGDVMCKEYWLDESDIKKLIE